jgi:gliding motility-associated-like protein
MLPYLTIWLSTALWPFGPAPDLKFPQPAPPCLTGIVNHYTPVVGFGCDSSTLQVGPVTGFNPGDKVLLLQMQVPQVDLSNTPSFGTVLNTSCIGNYELNRIQSVAGNVIQLQFALTRPYDLSGKVQLVRVPEYDSAMVCGITCLPWNGTVGGVLALDVQNLVLMGNLDVNGLGFRGGQVETNNIPWVFGEQQYFYPPQSTLAAQKGEGIVLIPQDFSFGRGRAGNGGGGGNAHNGGGGGGANGGIGGDGGLEITFPPPSATPNTSGIGGQKYFDNQTDKVLLGGGAGAGHANDELGSSGGAGGGIVFLSASSLQTNGFRILANGVDVFGGAEHNDGQGGGGAGGTILLQLGAVSGTLNCELRGGRGGSNPYTPQFQIHGPGGGGSGGKLLLTQAVPNVVPFLQGGINGFSSQGYSNGAQPGEPGKMLTGFVLPTGTEPAHPVSGNFSIALQDPSCVGQGGQIAVLQSTALLFNLNGGPWQPDSVFSNLTPGTYQVGLQFSGGCTLDTVAILQAPTPVLQTLISLSNAGCSGGGSLVVDAVSGTAPFEFQLNAGTWQSSGSFTNLFAGNFTVTMRDALGCTHTGNYVIAGAPPVQDSLLSLVHASCITGGEIEVTAVSGSAPFEFQLNGGGWQPSGLFANLPAGNYSITLRDAAGCLHSDDYVVDPPPPVQDSLLSLLDATCLAGGSISVNAISGTAPFEFQLNNGPWQSSGAFTDLPAGNYAIALRDAAGCSASNNYLVESPPPTQDSLLSIVDATCIADGTISVSAIAGTTPFEYQLNNGPWQASGLFSGLPAGNYSITLRDGAGCTATHNYEVEPPPPPQVSLLSLLDATCIAGGAISVNAFLGTAPFEFQLNSGAWQPNGAFSSLSAGNYTITLRDAAGCTVTENYEIEEPPPAQFSLLSLLDATCIAGGAIAVDAVSGTAPFEFQLNNGPWQPSGLFSALTAGNYFITVRDAAGCLQTNSYAIADPPPLVDSLLYLVAATCVLGGEISISAVSGTSPIEFQVNGGAWQTTGLFSGLPAGNYTLNLQDAAGCVHSSTYSVDGPPLPQDSLLSLIAATCLEGGQISVMATAGTAPFEYQINGGPWQNSGDFLNLPAGSYTLSLRDAGGCIQSWPYEVEAPAPLESALVAMEHATCVDGGSLELAAVSGTAPFEFQINGGPWQSNGAFLDLPPGDYLLNLRDAAGCLQSSAFVVSPPPPALDSLLALVDADCMEGGSISVMAISGTAPFQFQLDGGAWQTTGIFTDLPTGNYQITLRDAAFCTHVSNYQINEDAPLILQLDSLGDVDCRHPFGFVAVSASGGAGNYSFTLSPPMESNLDGYFPALYSDVYSITVTDSAGCETSLDNLAIDDLVDSVTTYESVTIYEGATFQLPDGTRTGRAGQYPFLYQTTEGCDSLHIIDIKVLKRHIYVPNVFMPNDDGSNNFFTVFSDDSLERIQRLSVFDRWGEWVFEKENFLPNDEPMGWDGNFRGRPVNPGVFVWMAKLKFKDGLELSISGNVTVVR